MRFWRTDDAERRPCATCNAWKQDAQKHQAMVDYWINEATRLRSQIKMSMDTKTEQEHKQLEDLVSYWKQIALAKEKEVVESHRQIVQLKNEIEQLKFLRGDMQRRLNEMSARITDAKERKTEEGAK